MNVTTLSPNHQSLIDKARQDLKRIENRGVSKAETLEDLRDTTGKSFRTADLEKLMEKYDPESYATYSKMSRTADGARTQGGLSYLSRWIDGVKAGLKNGTISSDSTRSSVNGTEKINSNTKRTAADELSYLSKKYSGYSFSMGVCKYGTTYGSSNTTNVMIDPRFLAKMANDPELEKEYEENIAAMKDLDEQFCRSVEAGGWHVVAQGWFIDKDGGIGGWCVTQKDDKKSFLENMSEKADKIREQNEEKKQEKLRIEEKRKIEKEEKAELKEKMEKANKDKFGDKFKEAIVIMKDDENSAVAKEEKVDDLDEEKELGDILDFSV